MAATTSFTPKSVTVGCAPNIYVDGYVYPSGPLAPGSSCVAPLVEIRNTLCEPVVVFYESRVEIGMDALANRQVIPGKGVCLITGLFPSFPNELSKIRVEDLHGNMECFVLEHSLTHGYDVFPLHHYEGGQGYWRRHLCPALDLEVARDPYAPQFCGCNVPSWGQTVIVPLRVSCAPQPPPEPAQPY